MLYFSIMGSLNIQRFANKVVEKVRSQEKVNLGAIAREVGYSESVATQPTKITRTKGYRNLTKPLLDGMQQDIKRLQLAMQRKDLDNEELRSLAYTYDLMVKNYQLLSGGATERQVFVLPSEVMETNNIIATQEAKEVKSDSGSVKP